MGSGEIRGALLRAKKSATVFVRLPPAFAVGAASADLRAKPPEPHREKPEAHLEAHLSEQREAHLLEQREPGRLERLTVVAAGRQWPARLFCHRFWVAVLRRAAGLFP